MNVNGNPLEVCSLDPVTGYTRDGYCRMYTNDPGTHTVCATMTDEFLNYTKQMGNDLSTPNPGSRFPGLVAGDKWCLCALRWKQANDAGKAPPVHREATHEATLRYTDLNTKERYRC
jgi:uncharacterized protein (DUF2237 family)